MPFKPRRRSAGDPGARIVGALRGQRHRPGRVYRLRDRLRFGRCGRRFGVQWRRQFDLLRDQRFGREAPRVEVSRRSRNRPQHFATIDSTDITNLMAGVLATAIPGAASYVLATAYAQTVPLIGRQRRRPGRDDEPDGTIQATYLGLPVRFSGKLPDVQTSLTGKPMLFFGNRPCRA
jgi:hypothetical protein